MDDNGSGRLARLFDRFGPFLGLLVVAGLFAAVAPSGFASAYNAKTILTQSVIVGVCALGMTFVIRSGGIDLSVGSAIAFASVVTALTMKATSSAAVATLAGVAAGAAVGAINGGLIAGLALPPFIVTLGTLGAARGAAKWIAGEQKVDAPSGWFEQAMSKSSDAPLGLAPGIWLMLLGAVAAAFVLRRTVFGVWTTAIGSNERAALLCGVPV
ncbi:MAG: ABC transporter permease, partial [Planctomycetota bacterium]|nr:ABC transporter permease [Planctomycetota bacterium]